MSRRFGRNQRRKAREQIAALEGHLVAMGDTMTVAMDRAGRQIWLANRRAEDAEQRPINQLTEEGLAYLGGMVGETIKKVEDRFLEHCLRELSKYARANLKLGVDTRLDAKRGTETVVRVTIPKFDFHFVPELGRLTCVRGPR